MLYLLYKSPVSIALLMRAIFWLLSIILLTGTPIVLAQNLTLFEETEATNVNKDRERAVRRNSDGNIVTGPEFILIGTTRIGESFVAVVKDRLGEIISVSVPEGAEVSIPGYPGFMLLDIGSGDVAIRYPGDLSCIEFRNQGVSCAGADIGRLELANADPLEGSASSIMLNNQNSPEASLTDEEPPNPFEALLERASNPNTESDTSAFTPRRINPEDVPPGMRVVSTPFGDRLVEEE